MFILFLPLQVGGGWGGGGFGEWNWKGRAGEIRGEAGM